MHLPYTIRPATNRDLPAILRLAAQESNFLGFLPALAIEEYVGRETAYVADTKYTAVAYTLGMPAMRYDKQIRPITHLCVARQFRRQGIATALVHAVTIAANTARQQIIQAWSRDDLDARHFWPALLFQPIGRRFPDTADKVPATCWRLSLTNDEPPQFHDLPKVGGYRAARQDKHSFPRRR